MAEASSFTLIPHMDNSEIKEIRELSDTPFSRGFLQGIDNVLHDHNKSFSDCETPSMEKILETWNEIKKQGVHLEQMDMPPDKAEYYGQKIGYNFGQAECIPDENKDAPDGQNENQEANTYLDTFRTALEDYIKENGMSPEKVETIWEVYECCSDLIQNIGTNLEKEGRSEAFITAVASGHAVVTAWDVEQSDIYAPNTPDDFGDNNDGGDGVDAVCEQDKNDDETSDETGDSDSGAVAASNRGNARTIEHIYEASAKQDESEDRSYDAPETKGLSRQDIEKLIIMNQLLKENGRSSHSTDEAKENDEEEKEKIAAEQKKENSLNSTLRSLQVPKVEANTNWGLFHRQNHSRG